MDQCGNPDNLSVEGTHAFTGKEVVAALLWDFDVLVAAHPAAPLCDYLGVLRRKATVGYRNAGFPNVDVSVLPEFASRRVVVRVVEGPRYLAGNVRVRGQRTLPLPKLVARLTRPYPPKEAVTQRSAAAGAAASAACWLDRDGKRLELADPVWEIGKPAHFPTQPLDGERYEAPFGKTPLHRNVADALADLGHCFARFNIDVEPDAKTKTACLTIDILDEGPRAVLGKVEVTGNKVNSRDDIVKYLGLRPGEPWNRTKSLDVGYRLWRSARFAKAEVNPVAPAAGQKGVTLRIAVVESERAPPLRKPLQRRRPGGAEISRLGLQSEPVARRHGLAGPRRGRQVDGDPLAEARGDDRGEAAGWPRGRTGGICDGGRGRRNRHLLRAAAVARP